MNPKTVKTYKTVKEAREILKQQEIDKILSREDIEEEAIRLAQNNGIIFIDEIDKIIHTGDKQYIVFPPLLCLVQVMLRMKECSVICCHL